MTFPRPHRLSTRLVAPFLVLVFFLSAAGTYAVTRQTFGTLQERQLARLADAATRAQLVFAAAERSNADLGSRLTRSSAVVDAVVARAPAATVAAATGAELGRTDAVAVTGDADDVRWTNTAGTLDLAALLPAFRPYQDVVAARSDAAGDKWAGVIGSGEAASLAAVAPIRAPAGQVVGAAIALRPLADVLRELRDSLGLDALVLRPDGTMITSTFGTDADAFGLDGADARVVIGGRRLSERRTWQHGSYTLSYGPLVVRGKAQAIIGVATADAPVIRAFNATRTRIVIIFAGGLLAVLLVGLALAGGIARTVDGLSSAVGRIAAGNFATRVDVRGSDEIGRLAAGFNTMAERLERYAAEQSGVIAELQSVDRAKDELLANVSHELRTPLTPIKGAASALRRSDVDDETRRQLADLVSANGDRMLNVVNRLIAATSAQTRAGVPDTPVPLPRVVAGVLGGLPTVEQSRVTIEVAPLVPDVAGDEAALRQVVFELVDNALKFSEAEVRIAVDTCGDDVEVEISDSGIGIPPDALQHVFERFYQVDASTTRRHGGLGLGLFVARDLARWMGGEITVGSHGAGTQVYCLLPAAGARTDAFVPATRGILTGFRDARSSGGGVASTS